MSNKEKFPDLPPDMICAHPNCDRPGRVRAGVQTGLCDQHLRESHFILREISADIRLERERLSACTGLYRPDPVLP